ncbi:protein kinase [bacterium]|nr:protein kinase [bacterium]
MSIKAANQKQTFQVDKYHINNHLGASAIGDSYSGFSLEDQLPVACTLFNEYLLTDEQLEELKRVNLLLAQQESENVLRPLAWGKHDGRHYAVCPEFGRPLSSYENLKALPPAELLAILKGLLKALCFAEGKGVSSHQSVTPDNISISLEKGEVKLGFFGYPMIELAGELESTGAGAKLLAYFPPEGFGGEPQQYDLYALGLITLELATAQAADEVLPAADRLDVDALRERIGEQDALPLPLKELILKLLAPVSDARYETYRQALDDVTQLIGEEESGLRFTTFILETLVGGRFRLGEEIARGRASRIYAAKDMRGGEGESAATEEGEPKDGEPKESAPAVQRPCVVKLIDLRSHPGMSEVFHTRFKQLISLRHDHIMETYDVGVHFENGYLAMEAGLQSLEQLLIKRGTLPLTDAGRIIFQICKALEGLQFHQIDYHGAIQPSNVFLTNNLRTIKLGDAVVAGYFLHNGNLNSTGAEYFCPEFIKGEPFDIRSDIYGLGLLFYELLVGHPPFSFKIESEIIEDHLHMDPASRVGSALISSGSKEIILRMLEKNPAGRYQDIAGLKDELTILLGYDKKEQVEVPNLFFDFAELSMVGKNTKEKTEDTLAVRLPAVNNRARGTVALLVGHGREEGDSSRAAASALRSLREMLFHPGSVSVDFAKLQKADPEKYLDHLVEQLNQRLYREAFSAGKTKSYGLSAAIGFVQENTLYLQLIGDVSFTIYTQGEILDSADDKWTITGEATLGDEESALSSEAQDRLGYGEVFKVQRLKRRLKDGDQLLLLSANLMTAMSPSEIRELITSSSDPAQVIEMVRGDAIRRRLEGTVSCLLLNIGNVAAYAEEKVSHAKKGMLARNFLARGDTHLNDGLLDDAIEQYTQALEINPNFAIIHHQLGLAYARKGLVSYAQSCFDRALKMNNKLAASYMEIAKIFKQQRRQREVLPLYRQAVACGCKDAGLFADFGRELLHARSYDEAILYCTHALALDSAHPTAFRDRMVASKRKNHLDTKLLKMFSSRRRLADEETRISPGTEVEQADEDYA